MFSWNVWPISMGWPVVVISAQARPILRQKFFMAVSRMAYVRCGDGHAPGRAQRCFSPARSRVAQPVFDVDAGSYAGDAVELFGAKAIGYARLDGEEVGGDGFDFYVCWFGHGFVFRENKLSAVSKTRVLEPSSRYASEPRSRRFFISVFFQGPPKTGRFLFVSRWIRAAPCRAWDRM